MNIGFPNTDLFWFPNINFGDENPVSSPTLSLVGGSNVIETGSSSTPFTILLDPPAANGDTIRIARSNSKISIPVLGFSGSGTPSSDGSGGLIVTFSGGETTFNFIVNAITAGLTSLNISNTGGYDNPPTKNLLIVDPSVNNGGQQNFIILVAVNNF